MVGFWDDFLEGLGSFGFARLDRDFGGEISEIGVTYREQSFFFFFVVIVCCHEVWDVIVVTHEFESMFSPIYDRVVFSEPVISQEYGVGA